MSYYYKINDSEDELPPYKGFHLQKVNKLTNLDGPNINYDFSKHVLIELLDDVTPESELWSEMGLKDDCNVIHKRMMVDSHRIKCRRAVVICKDSEEAKRLAQRLSQTKVMKRCICAVVVQDLLSDLCLFEKQIIQFGDNRSQNQLLYVSDLSRSRGPSGLVQFLREKFSPFGTILSVLVCSDSDDYAFPEGVIKFSYLSEAFAAELAFDQFVIGKERLSVTTHHNVLLSQCDLRARLKYAQLCCNIENNEFSGSLFRSLNHSCHLNNLEFISDSVENSMSNLHISHGSNFQGGKEDSLYDALERTLPVILTQRNCCKNSSKNDRDKTISSATTKNCAAEQNISNIILSEKNNSMYCNNNNNNISNIKNSPALQYAPENDPFEMSATRIMNHANKSKNRKSHSRKNLDCDSIGKLCEKESDSGSFLTCNSFKSKSKSNILSPSSKNSSYESFNSLENNSVLEFQSETSNPKELSSPLKDFEVIEECQSKHSKKRKKKFYPSQKLCLKSQRTGSSQNSVLNMDTTQISKSVSTEQDNFSQCKQSELRKRIDLPTTVNSKKTKSREASKVADWLGSLPVTNVEVEDPFSKTMEEICSESVLIPKSKFCRSKISIHRTPALKSNLTKRSENKILCPDSFSENDNPNGTSLISSSNECNSIPVTEKYKSPLQMWLKQELTSSTSNSGFGSKESSKSIVVCTTKTKHVVISVGCSHMTCDTCYPESNGLLLGYS